ncbi:hypothetical protein C2S51_023911 [Perilla frutescens var. frutescens]|nr:hypothetical protein C2S51_023911 [Perilla frutescens var. frutescens]
MNRNSSLPNVLVPTKNYRRHRSPIPPAAVYILLALFLVGLCVSTFFLIVVHNAFFFVLLLCFSTPIAAFLFWNSRNAAVSFFLHSFPDSDLNLAAHGQLVKITGVCMYVCMLLLLILLLVENVTLFPLFILVVSCGNVSLESSYEKVSPCVYTSTMLYEYRGICFKVRDISSLWRLAYSERHSTDFYITDLKSGIRALVKAGPDSKVIPLIVESRLIRTSKGCRVLSSDLRKWLAERKVSTEVRSLCLKEGYIKEGSSVSVVGILQKVNDILMIAQPHEMLSTGCRWPKLLLPMDVEGLIIGFPETATVDVNCQ